MKAMKMWNNRMSCVLLLATLMSIRAEIPALRQQGTATQLVVDGRPFLILGGEFGNSTAASVPRLQIGCKKAQALGLNTILVPVYWDLIEPQAEQFDFHLVDEALQSAFEHGLKLVLLWFGSWKNSMSCYAPLWIKEDYKQYPRAETESGKMMEMLSTFNRNNLAADQRAFVQLMRHLAEHDIHQTVIMVQVENEIGMLGSAREYGPEADKAYLSAVPETFIRYLSHNKQTLHPSLHRLWKAQGFKTTGNWPEIFGNDVFAQEVFMAYHYGMYVQKIAQAGKITYPIPLYVNAALNSRDRKPGEYPGAGPLAHLIDVWRAAAPAIDFIAPDIYDPGFAGWCAQYQAAGNPLFIPEIRLAESNAVHALYAFGEHDAMGFSPFSIEDIDQPEQHPLAKSYRILQQLSPLLVRIQGKQKTKGVLLDNTQKQQEIVLNGYKFTFSHGYTLPWENPKHKGSWEETGALLIALSDTEYLIAGTGIAVTFENTDKKGFTTGIGYVDEVEFINGKMHVVQRLSGDQTHQGRHLRIPVGAWSIQYVKLYDYQ